MSEDLIKEKSVSGIFVCYNVLHLESDLPTDIAKLSVIPVYFDKSSVNLNRYL